MASDGTWGLLWGFVWVLPCTWRLVGWFGIVWGRYIGVYSCLGSSGDTGDGRNRVKMTSTGVKMASGGTWGLLWGFVWVLPCTWRLVGWFGVVWGRYIGVCSCLGSSGDTGDGRNRVFQRSNGVGMASGGTWGLLWGFVWVLPGTWRLVGWFEVV